MSNFSVDLSKCTALVTGGGAGAGAVIALALAACGASVATSDINIERAESVAERIKAQGGAAMAHHVDVSNRFQVADMIERTRDALGGIDILVNAAEIYHPEPLLTIDEWNWRRQLEVNITGAFFCLQLVARVMADEGGGTILNVTSAEALDSTLAAGIGFLAGKAGLAAMTRQAARELAAHQIRVNAIAVRQRESDSSSGKACADAALFLCSQAARHISGDVLVIDNGWQEPHSRDGSVSG